MPIRAVVGQSALASWIKDGDTHSTSYSPNDYALNVSRQLKSLKVALEADVARRSLRADHAVYELNQSDDPRTKRKPQQRWTLLAIAALLAAVIAALYAHYLMYSRYFQSTDDATVKADVVTVSPRIGGYVKKVLVVDGEDVKVGQPLIQIDPQDFHRQEAKAQAQGTQAVAAADSARASINEQYAAIDQAKAKLAAARSQSTFDAGEVARYEPLVASGAETRSTLAQLRKAAAQSASEFHAQTATLAIQQRRIESLRAQLREGEAQADGANAQIALAKSDVDATLLRASIAGRVGAKNVEVGNYVQTGARLMSIVPLKSLYIIANFKETQLNLMRRGQPVTISVDAFGGMKLRGRVDSMAPGTGSQFALIPPENATGNFTKITQRIPVKIAIAPTKAVQSLLLVPGLSVTVTVDTSSVPIGSSQRYAGRPPQSKVS